MTPSSPLTHLACACLLAATATLGFACAKPAEAAALTRALPHAVADVVHVPPAEAPAGSDRYFKLHLDVDHLAPDSRSAQELQYYLNYQLRHDLWLSDGVDSLNPDVYFHEPTHGLTGRESVFVGFPEGYAAGGRLRLGGVLAAHHTYDIDPRPLPAPGSLPPRESR